VFIVRTDIWTYSVNEIHKKTKRCSGCNPAVSVRHRRWCRMHGSMRNNGIVQCRQVRCPVTRMYLHREWFLCAWKSGGWKSATVYSDGKTSNSWILLLTIYSVCIYFVCLTLHICLTLASAKMPEHRRLTAVMWTCPKPFSYRLKLTKDFLNSYTT